MANQTTRTHRSARPGHQKRLRPTGHSATIEALIQPAIVVGSTLMSAIAAYVLALDEITRILARVGAPADVFVVALCAGMGFLIDMAIIVSATRYKMHAIRADPRERRWLQLAKWVLVVGLVSESMTLFYFFVHLDPAAFPPFLLWLATMIHAALAISRAFLPPVVIAYFAAGVLPVMFDRADRNREIKSRTSSNIMLLIDRLSEVLDTDDKAEMLRALGGQLMLDTYATYDETARTTEDQQLRRDAKLLAHLARIHRLDWSAIAADVAPELASQPAGQPAGQPAAQRAPEGKRKEEEDGEEEPQPQPAPPPAPQPVPLRPPARTPATGTEGDDEPTPALAPAAATAAVAAVATRDPRRATRASTSATLSASSRASRRRTAARAAERAADGTLRVDAAGADETPDRLALRQRREEAARRILDETPDISTGKLAQRIAMATRTRISESTARAIREQLEQLEQLEPLEQREREQPAAPRLHVVAPPPLTPAPSQREQREN